MQWALMNKNTSQYTINYIHIDNENEIEATFATIEFKDRTLTWKYEPAFPLEMKQKLTPPEEERRFVMLGLHRPTMCIDILGSLFYTNPKFKEWSDMQHQLPTMSIDVNDYDIVWIVECSNEYATSATFVEEMLLLYKNEQSRTVCSQCNSVLKCSTIRDVITDQPTLPWSFVCFWNLSST